MSITPAQARCAGLSRRSRTAAALIAVCLATSGFHHLSSSEADGGPSAVRGTAEIRNPSALPVGAPDDAPPAEPAGDPVVLPAPAEPAPAEPEAVPPAAAPAVADTTEPVCLDLPDLPPLCTHGDDRHLLDDHDQGHGQDADSETAGAPSTRIGCYGDGRDGPRIQAVYLRPDGSADRYGALAADMRVWAANADRQFDDSARKSGSTRHLRWATSPGPDCTLAVLRMTLPAADLRSYPATVKALQQRKVTAPFTKYLLWVDADVYCGLASVYRDDRGGLDNVNNGSYPNWARIDRPCWGQVEAHEIMHMLGGVQPSAPNSTAGFHCNDGFDVMCYPDGTARSTQRVVCPSAHRRLFDCGENDYFSAAARPTGYLATHWNTASSRFLAPGWTGPASPPPPPPAQPSPTPAPEPDSPPTAGGQGLLPSLTEPLRDLLPVLVDPLRLGRPRTG